MKKVYVCNDNISGIFSAVYDAWKTRLPEERLGIALRGMICQELFCEYVEIEESEKKVIAVENLIKKHLGDEAYWNIYHAILTDDSEKGDAVLGTMLEARKISDSTKIMQHLTHPKVRKVFELSRTVANEAHFFKEFLRFRELQNGVLFAKINPKNQVLTCIADHFANRLPLENWMIYDEKHGTFLVHPAQKQWILVLNETLNVEEMMKVSPSEVIFSELWQDFFKSISIGERESMRRQRQHLPLRFRDNMTEFCQ